MESPHPGETSSTPVSHHGKAPSSSPKARYRGRVRTGCLVCRTRKIKCDEQRPSCQKCTRLNKTCVYKAPSRFEPHQTIRDTSTGSAGSKQDHTSMDTNLESAFVHTETRGYPVHEQSEENAAENVVNQSSQTDLRIPDDIEHTDSGIIMCANADESPSSQQSNPLCQGNNMGLAETPSERLQRTSDLIYISTTMDWLAAAEGFTPSSFSYFINVVDCPLISPFDYLNWKRFKTYVADLGLRHFPVSEALLAIQVLYRAQVDRLPMTHASSVYRNSVATFETTSADVDIDFDIVLVVAFILCLCVATLPNEDSSCFTVLDGAFATRLEAWLLSGHQTPVSLRICAWLQLLNTTTKRPGSAGLLSEPILSLLYDHVKQVPILSELDRDAHPEHSLHNAVAAPVFDFYLKLQRMSNRVADVTHYRRSRNTPEDQAEVVELMGALKTELSSLWESRPALLRLQPDTIRDHFSLQLSGPLISLAAICIAAFHTEIIVIGRILGDPPFPSQETQQALKEIRDICDGDWNVSTGGTVNAGYVRPLFVYALESFDRNDTEWAAERLRRIKHPISRTNFLASFVEAHGEAQRTQARRVTMKYFCYQTFGVPLPYM